MAFDVSVFDGIPHELDETILAEEGLLIAVENKVVDYLHAVPEFHALSTDIIIEDLETLPNRLDDAMTGIAPLLLIVRIVSAQDKASGVPGILRLDPLTLEVRILENPKTNRGAGGSHITRNKAAELVALALKLRRVGNSHLAVTAIDDIDVGDGYENNLLGKSVTFTLSAEVN